MKLGSIQLLRALAACMVVYWHCVIQMHFFAPGWRPSIRSGTNPGEYGVDLFFVISGFIIYHTSAGLGGTNQSLAYLWRRFRRINPVYYAATILTLIIWLPSFLNHRRPPVTLPDVGTSLILLPFPGATAPILSQAWTLSFEWYFYLLFFLLILFRSQKKAAHLSLILGTMILIGLCLRNRQIGVFGFYTDPLIAEFLAGVGVGVLYQYWTPGKIMAGTMLVLGVLLSIALLVTGYHGLIADTEGWDPVGRAMHALCWGGSAALVVAGSVLLEKTRKIGFFRDHPLILLLGDASYSIYLFHYIIIGLIGAFYLRKGLFLPHEPAVVINSILTVAGCLAFYKWIELPLLRSLGRKSRLTPTPSPPVGT